MPKKKSLADELADLLNPAPAKEFDPEADVFGAGPTLEESEDEGLAAEAKAGRRGKEGSRMRGEIVMEGKAYAGRRSSRAALFGDDGGSVGGSEGEAEEEQGVAPAAALASEGDSGSEEEGEEEEEEEGEEEGEEEAQGEGWLNGHGGASGGSSSSEDEEGDGEAPEVAAAGSGGRTRRRGAAPLAAADAGAGSSDEEAEEEEEEEEEEGGEVAGGGAAGVVAAAEAAELAALEKEYEAMQQDEQTAVAGLRERAGKERKKALAVQAQTSVWQRGLEARILLQRALAGANRLPQGRMQAAAAAADDELAAAFGGLAADASALLADLLSLLRTLAAQNPAIADAATAAAEEEEEGRDTPAASKRARHADPAATAAAAEGEEAGGKAAATWRQLDEAYAAFAPFRDASIDRWHRKTVLTTGGTALRGGQLRALNQSVSTQVAALMQDPGKVLRRTHVTRAAQQAEQHRVLCPDPDTHQAKRWRGDDGAEETEANVDEERDPETFDDSEFYQTLLREFLEASSDVAGAGNWRTGPKQRKAVDRRASKGRRLRYHVHDKLVSFMAPVELDAPQFAPQLFSHLFGGGGAK